MTADKVESVDMNVEGKERAGYGRRVGFGEFAYQIYLNNESCHLWGLNNGFALLRHLHVFSCTGNICYFVVVSISESHSFMPLP